MLRKAFPKLQTTFSLFFNKIITAALDNQGSTKFNHKPIFYAKPILRPARSALPNGFPTRLPKSKRQGWQGE